MNQIFNKISKKFNNFKNDPRTKKLKKFLNNSNGENNNKNSISSAVSIGLFCGLFPAPFQMISAASIAYYCKANILIAIFVTLYTNPITIFPIYFIGYKLGEYIINFVKNFFNYEIFFNLNNNHSIIKIEESFNFQWFLDQSGIFIFGNLILGFLLAFLGYFVTQIFYEIFVKKNKLK